MTSGTTTCDTFVDAAARLCAAAHDLGMPTGVLLHRRSGPPGLAVDAFSYIPDDLRRWVVTEESWRVTPVMIELRRQLAILDHTTVDLPLLHAQAREHGYAGADRHPLAVPLLGPAGWFGTVMHAPVGAPTVACERQLVVLATELSVWCTARGISTLPEVRPLAPRQHEVATLAANGRTNPEIADALGISVNTVKLRLKQVFERLAVDNRTELANVLRRLAPLEGIPMGITHRDRFAITRGI